MAVETLRPNGAGNETAIPYQSPTFASHFDKVNETVADDASTTVWTDYASYTRDLYALPAHTNYGVISNIKVIFRGMTTDNEIGYMKPAIRIGGVTYDGDEVNFSGISNWQTFDETWTQHPIGGAWTWANIDDLEIGVSVIGDGNTNTFCTQVYVEVNYTEQWTGTINGVDNPDEICGVAATDIAKVNGIKPG